MKKICVDNFIKSPVLQGTLYVTDTKQYMDDEVGSVTSYAGGIYYKMWMFSSESNSQTTFPLNQQPRKVTFLTNDPSYLRSQGEFYIQDPRVGSYIFSRSEGRVVRASTSGAVHLGLIPSRVESITLKLLFTAFLLDTQY